jgi:predicted nucleic acid-binding protein
MTAPSLIYLDASALVKYVLAEKGSEELEDLIVGRRDVILSDLAVTELVSALARRIGEGDLEPSGAQAIYRRVIRDMEEGRFLRAELSSAVHRRAERLLLEMRKKVPLRAADALHLALAGESGAQRLATYDRRMYLAATALGTMELIPGEVGNT